MFGAEHIISVIGPLATTLPAISLFMSVCLNYKPWLYDPMLVPIPWREESHFQLNVLTGKTKKMKIGVMKWDGVVMPHPPVTRCLDEVVKRLEEHKQEFEVVEWNAWEVAR